MRSRIFLVATLAAIAAAPPPSCGQSQQGEPTKEEIAQAYRSKSGEHGLIIPGARWETWGIQQIRGWSLKFKRLTEERSAGVQIRRYLAFAKKNDQCAAYLIVDSMPFPPVNVQIKPSLTVEPGGVKACR
ncbi:MAG: hypothetical protein ACM3S5_08595 [Rhodospirillales bacterium]